MEAKVQEIKYQLPCIIMPLMKLPTIPLFNLTRFSCLIKILMNQSTTVCFNCGMIILMIMVLLRVIDLIAPYLQMHLFFISLKSHFSRQLSMYLFFCSYLGGLNKVHIINSPCPLKRGERCTVCLNVKPKRWTFQMSWSIFSFLTQLLSLSLLMLPVLFTFSFIPQ